MIQTLIDSPTQSVKFENIAIYGYKFIRENRKHPTATIFDINEITH